MVYITYIVYITMVVIDLALKYVVTFYSFLMSKRSIVYKYLLHERVTWEIVTPRIPMSTEAKPRLTLVFEG